MKREQTCRFDDRIPCCEALRVLMFRDYVHYVVQNNLPLIFGGSDESIKRCAVPQDWCPHYREHHNKPKCPYDANIICDKKYQLEEYYRQRSEADKVGKSYSFNADGECPVVKDMCPRYLATQQKQR